MLVIRLARTGRTKYPTYRLVAAESARAATGKFVAILGHYNPHTKEFVVKKAEVEKYLGNGAQPSNTVVKLLKQEKVKLPDWVKYTEKNRQPKKAAKEKAPAPAKSDDTAAPAPVDETGTENEETVAKVATEEAAGKEAETPEAAPEDTAAGEATQAAAVEVVEAAGDAAIEVTKEAKTK